MAFKEEIDRIISETKGIYKEKISILSGEKVQLYDGYRVLNVSEMERPDRKKGHH